MHKRQAQAALLVREHTLAADYEGFPHATTMATFPPAVHDVFNFDDLLTPDERDNPAPRAQLHGARRPTLHVRGFLACMQWTPCF